MKEGIPVKITNPSQIINILQNLTNLEISYLEYSRTPKDFSKYRPYLEYFNNYILRSRELFRFYFPMPMPADLSSDSITELDEVGEINIVPGYDFAVSKQFNFPNAPRHKCSYYTLVCVLKEGAELTLDKTDFRLKRGDFYLIPTGVYYAIQPDPDSICVCFNMRKSFIASQYREIFLDDPLIVNFITQSLAPEHSMTYLALHTDGNEAIFRILLTIFAEYINQDRYSNTAMKSYLTLMFTTMLRDENTTIDASVQTTRQERQYRQIVSCLKQYYQTADLSFVSDHLHFSKQYICRIVKEASGETFNTLLMKIRLEMVEQYLMDSDLTLETISCLCGFAAPSHLSKVFKKHFGISPSEYRNLPHSKA